MNERLQPNLFSQDDPKKDEELIEDEYGYMRTPQQIQEDQDWNKSMKELDEELNKIDPAPDSTPL